ncbi:E3 ubiquitin-protein ligase MIB2-like protein [Leptotrombidium deliense]|uniref:Alpha-latrotoxin n=1 Tax=Leptotrombidium deliense TaxID=299467 RepID=A0A443S4W8_9ACAR|nr:E3 ubiquitin-protein ligase MIB2-like protein [Leptotrombidium deliense]
MNEKEAYLHHLVVTGKNDSIEDLLENNDVEINAKDEKGNSVLHKAAKEGNEELLAILLDNGADINAVNYKLNSALHVAIKNVAVDCVEFLLKENIQVNRRNEGDETELLVALSLFESEKDKIIGMLINCENIDLKIVFLGGRNYLHHACEKGNVLLAEKLITEYPALHKKDNQNDYPIHFAAYEGHRAIVNLMFENIPNLNINICGSWNWPLLFGANWKTQLSTIELLVSKGANCNLKLNDGNTCFTLALGSYITCCLIYPYRFCPLRSKVDICNEIKTIYNDLSNGFRKQCVHLALAIYLIKYGNADIYVQDNSGVFALTRIKVVDKTAYDRLILDFETKRERNNFQQPLSDMHTKVTVKSEALPSETHTLLKNRAQKRKMDDC